VTPEDFGMEFAPLPFGSIVLRVPDVEATKEKLRGEGVEFRGETWDSGVCNGASFFDPDGNGLAIHRRYAPYLDGSEP
jgi:predicted enzyme related to lactoylglutathione lyase